MGRSCRVQYDARSLARLLFSEAAARRPVCGLKNVEHACRRATDLRLAASHHNRELDQNRVCNHGADQRVVIELRVIKVELLVNGLAFPHQIARAYLEFLQDRPKFVSGRRFLQIFNDSRFDSLVRKQSQRLPRFGATGIVIDGYFRHRLLPSKDQSFTSAPTASLMLAKPSAASRAASSRLMRVTSAGPS